MEAKPKKAKKIKKVKAFDFTDTKCSIPIELDRYRVTLGGKLAMAIPVRQDGMLLFKVKIPLRPNWTEHFKEELELADFYHNQEVFAKWSALK